jgi:hypothetical protein
MSEAASTALSTAEGGSIGANANSSGTSTWLIVAALATAALIVFLIWRKK